MKQEHRNNNLLPSYFQQHELEVAAILLDVPRLIEKSSLLSWSVTRKRSSRSRGSAGIDSLPLPAFSPPAAVVNSSVVIRYINPKGDDKKKKEEKAVSPSTPLSFPLSAEESGEQPPPRSKRRSFVKRSIEEWKEKLEESEEQGRVLRNEIDKVRGYYNSLVQENSSLRNAYQRKWSLQEEQRRLRIAETQLAESRRHTAFFMAVNGNGFDRAAMYTSGCSSSGYVNIDLENSESKRVDVYSPANLGDFWRRQLERNAKAREARKKRKDERKKRKDERNENEQLRLGVNSKRRKLN
ncbi:hypothetical protein LINGRAHAP2_LOCUS10012 [Linum grandiflorum]